MRTNNKTLKLHIMKSTRLAFLSVLTLMVCGCILSCGCLSVLSQSGAVENSPAANGTGLRAILIDQDADWGLSRGCVWTTTFQVSNPGSMTFQNINLHVELVNARTGAVRDTKVIFLGSMGPGEEETVRVALDGECLDEYTVRAIPVVSGS